MVGLVLAGCSSESGPDVDSLTVSASAKVELSGPARLSPDATKVLALTARPCVRDLDGADEVCVDEDVDADLANAAWSPDGTKLVFTDDFWKYMREPDVWVFDVTSGELRALTDDGVDDFDLSGPNEGADLDVLPSWSTDGEDILFVRGQAKADTAELMSVPADGGEPSTLREIDCELTDVAGLAWSASRVAWTCGLDSPEVFLADHTGGEAQRAVPGEGGQDRMLLSFSPDGEWLLVDSFAQYGQYAQPAGGQALVVPADGGDPVPLADKAGYPTWSPEGHALAYIAVPDKLMVLAEPAGEPAELRTAKAFSAPDDRRLAWAADRILLNADREPVLLTLTE
ncbi:hypothetical protein GCM10027436_72090 [Actinophytocola sediminis]